MSRDPQRDFPHRVWSLFDEYVHGAIDRRAFLRSRRPLCRRRLDSGNHPRCPESALCRGAAGAEERCAGCRQVSSTILRRAAMGASAACVLDLPSGLAPGRACWWCTKPP